MSPCLRFALWFIVPKLLSISANFDCISLTSTISGTQDDDKTFIECNSSPYSTLVSCGCKPKNPDDSQSDGCYIVDQRCYAQNGIRGSGMYAIARCCSFNPDINIDCNALVIPQLAKGDGGMQAITCGSSTHKFLTGCSVSSAWSGFDGSYPGTMNPNSHPPKINTDYPLNHLNSYCTAVNGKNNKGSIGHLMCCDSHTYDLKCVLRYGAASDTQQESYAVCGAGYEMMSCSGYGDDTTINSWYISDDKCIARSHNKRPVYAIAICCKLETESPTTDPTETPTANPTIFPTKEPSVSPTVEPTMQPIAAGAAGRMIESKYAFFRTWFWVIILVAVIVCGMLIWKFMEKRKEENEPSFIEMDHSLETSELHKVWKRNVVNYTDTRKSEYML